MSDTKYFSTGFLVFAVLVLLYLPSKAVLEGFEPYKKNACVINLKRREDRLKKFKAKLKSLECDVIEAVDGNNLQLDYLVDDGTIGDIALKSIMNTKNGIKKSYHYEVCTMGAVGCYLSHVRAWESITQDNMPYRIIFEDDADVRVTQTWANLVNENIKQLPSDWHVYLIGQPHTFLKTEDTDEPNLKRVLRFCGLHAYIVSKQGAEWLLKNGKLFPIQQQIDSHMSELASDYGLNVYIHKNFPLIPPIADKTDIQVDSHQATDDRLFI